MSFSAEYFPLILSRPELAKIATLPWDEVIFGFPVADLTFAHDVLSAKLTLGDVRELLCEFSRQSQSELVSCSVGAEDTRLQSFLVGEGFAPVDYSLISTLQPLKLESLPEQRFGIRVAAARDIEAIMRIAESAFKFGRYHGDPRFPRELADRRYAMWAKNALEGDSAEELVLVLGSDVATLGFMHVVMRDGHADLRLGAIDPEIEAGFLGFALYTETLRFCCSKGTRNATAKIAVANTRVMNILTSLRFQFARPMVTFHWHSPYATHLHSSM